MKKFDTIITFEGSLHEKVGNIEYKLTRKQWNELLKKRNADEKKIPPVKFLCKYINDNYGLKGNVVNVLCW